MRPPPIREPYGSIGGFVSLFLAFLLLGLVLLGTAARLAKVVYTPWTGLFGVTAAVALFARGEEPAVTYVRAVALVVSAILLALRLSTVGRVALHRMRAELLVAGLLAAAVGSSFFVGLSPTSQKQWAVLIAALGAVFIVLVLARFGALVVRMLRHRVKPA